MISSFLGGGGRKWQVTTILVKILFSIVTEKYMKISETSQMSRPLWLVLCTLTCPMAELPGWVDSPRSPSQSRISLLQRSSFILAASTLAWQLLPVSLWPQVPSDCASGRKWQAPQQISGFRLGTGSPLGRPASRRLQTGGRLCRRTLAGYRGVSGLQPLI